MQKENGSFYSRYIPSEGGRWDEQHWDCSCFTKRILQICCSCQLLKLLCIWLSVVRIVLIYLPTIGNSWLLKKILSFENVAVLPVSRELLINHAVRISDAILQDHLFSENNKNRTKTCSVKDRSGTPHRGCMSL